MPTPFDLPILLFGNAKAWRSWLAAHHGESVGIWLRFMKKGSGKASVTYAEALDEALCYGWIDGQKRTYDAESYVIRFTPRRSRSIWSALNTRHVARLRKTGRMRAAGLRAVEAAKADGRWEAAYASQRSAVVPADFLRRLGKDKKALAAFKALPKSEHYAVYWRLQTAKTPETRERRMLALLATYGKGGRLRPMTQGRKNGR